MKLNSLSLLMIASLASNVFALDAGGPPKKAYPVGILTLIEKERGRCSLQDWRRGYLFNVSTNKAKGDKEGKGHNLWDISDPKNPKRILAKGMAHGNRHDIAWMGGTSDYAFMSGWMVHWPDPTKPYEIINKQQGAFTDSYQYPLVFLGSAVSGRKDKGVSIYRYNLSSNKTKYLSRTQILGSSEGVQAFGNLLIGGGKDKITVWDISNPSKPKILDQSKGAHDYGGGLHGRYYVSGKYVHDISNPANIKLHGTLPEGDRYQNNSQNGWLLFTGRQSGGGEKFWKVQLDDLKLAKGYPISLYHKSFGSGGEREFCLPIGNVAAIGSTHEGQGVWLVQHAEGFDKTAPKADWVNPMPNATNQALTSRVGVSMDERVLPKTVDNKTLMIRPIGGKALDGWYTVQFNIINFHPKSDLKPNTTYEIRVVKGGMQDLVGNSVQTEFVSYFSTGNKINGAKSTHLAEGAVPVQIGEGYVHRAVNGRATGSGRLWKSLSK